MNNNTSAAIETLLYRNGLSEKDIQDAFALFSGYNIDYADFYFQRSVSEGYVYYSTDEDTSDEVIIARAASQDKVENVEKAISAELTAKTTAWQNNEKESKKIENHVMRTIGDCVLLVIGDKSNEIDQVFNQLKEE